MASFNEPLAAELIRLSCAVGPRPQVAYSALVMPDVYRVMNRASQELVAKDATIAALQAVVDKLPKDSRGNALLPSSNVVRDDDGASGRVEALFEGCVNIRILGIGVITYMTEEVARRFTEAAALAAMKQKES